MSDPATNAGPVVENDPAQRSTAALGHYLGILGILGAGIFYLIKKNDTTVGPFAKQQMKEVFNFEIVVFAAYIALMIVGIVLALIVPKLALLVSLADLVLFVGNIALCVMAAGKAGKGIAAKYPITFPILK